MVVDVRNRRLHRRPSGRADLGGRAAPARVSGLRQRGPGHDRSRSTDRAQAGRPGAECWRNCSTASRPRGSAGSATRAGRPTDRPPTAMPIRIWAVGQGEVTVARRAQRRDRKPRRPAPRARVAGLHVCQSDRYRGHRPPDRPRAGDGGRPVRGRAARLAAARRDVRAGGRQSQAARRGHRRPVRQPAGRRSGRGRAPAGQRPGGDRAPHGAGRVSCKTARSSA